MTDRRSTRSPLTRRSAASSARPRRPTRPGAPRKRFGQHFLAGSWAKKVVDAVHAVPGDVFLEIGPGRGALTLPLAATGAPVLAVEIDRQLVEELAPIVPPNVTVLSGDILTANVLSFLSGLQPQSLPGDTNPPPARRFRVVGNLPYYIASPILIQLVEWHRRHHLFVDATVMVQREMADRLVARPSSKDYGVLTVMLALHATITRVLDLPPGAFHPPPKVKSSVVRLVFGPPAVRLPDEALFERMVKALFGQRRKTLANALKRFDAAGLEVLERSGMDGRRRPETLALDELARLAELFATHKAPRML